MPSRIACRVCLSVRPASFELSGLSADRPRSQECSAKTSIGVKQAFQELVTQVRPVLLVFHMQCARLTVDALPLQIIKTPSLYSKQIKPANTVELAPAAADEAQGGYCAC